MFFVPIPKAIAKERGLKFFLKTSPCKRGNIFPRRVSNSHCTCFDCAQRTSKLSMAWRKNNPERAAIIDANYRANNRAKLRARTKTWRDSNKDLALHLTQVWRKNNTEALTEYERLRWKKHSESIKIRQRRYRLENKAKFRTYYSKRRTLLKHSKLSWFNELDSFVLEECYKLNYLRQSIFNFEWNMDHMIPLQAKTVKGLHVWNNFQSLPKVFNQFKKNKLIYTNPHEWLCDIPKFFKVIYQQEIAA